MCVLIHVFLCIHVFLRVSGACDVCDVSGVCVVGDVFDVCDVCTCEYMYVCV